MSATKESVMKMANSFIGEVNCDALVPPFIVISREYGITRISDANKYFGTEECLTNPVNSKLLIFFKFIAFSYFSLSSLSPPTTRKWRFLYFSAALISSSIPLPL